MELNRASLEALFTGYQANFQQGFNSLGDAATAYQALVTEVPSTHAQEVYPWLKQLPRMREWLGDRVIHGIGSAAFSIKNRKFENTVSVSRDAIEDDSYGLYGPLMQELGRTSAEHPNLLVVEVLEGNPLCYDGQYLFDTDHPVLDASGAEQSVANAIGGAGAAWYVLDLSRAIPRHTHTLVPANLEGAARKVLQNQLASGGETNEWAGTSTLLINPWLAQA